MTLKERIQLYTKTVANDDEATQWIKDGLRDIVNRYLTIAPDQLYQFAKTFTVGDAGLTLNSRAPILDVMLGDYSCAEIQPAYRKKAADQESIYYATEASPVFWRLGQTLYIQPTPADSGVGLSISVANTHTDGTEFTCTELIQFRPGDVINISGVANGASVDGNGELILSTNFNAAHIISSITGQYSFTVPMAFLDNFVLTSATVIRPTASATIVSYDDNVTVSSSSVQNFPDELLHVLVLYVSCSELSKQMLTIKDSMPSDLNTLTGILATADIASIFSKLNLASITLPTTADGTTPTIRDAADFYTNYQVSGTGDDDQADATLSTWLSLYGNAISADLTKLNDYIEDDEDPELAGAKLQEIQLKMTEISTQFQNAQTKYNLYLQEQADKDRTWAASIQKYQLDVQNAIQDWSTEWGKREKLWAMKVAKHMQDYQFLQSQFQYVMQKYEQSFGSTTGAA